MNQNGINQNAFIGFFFFSLPVVVFSAFTAVTHAKVVGDDGKTVIICGFRPLLTYAEWQKLINTTHSVSAGIQFSQLPGNKPSEGSVRTVRNTSGDVVRELVRECTSERRSSIGWADGRNRRKKKTLYTLEESSLFLSLSFYLYLALCSFATTRHEFFLLLTRECK